MVLAEGCIGVAGDAAGTMSYRGGRDGGEIRDYFLRVVGPFAAVDGRSFRFLVDSGRFLFAGGRFCSILVGPGRRLVEPGRVRFGWFGGVRRGGGSGRAVDESVQGLEFGAFGGVELVEVQGRRSLAGEFMGELSEFLDEADLIGGVVFLHAALAALAAVGDAVEGVEQEPQFAGGMDAALVAAVFGLIELLEDREELIFGEGFGDLLPVLLELFEVAADRGVGAAHLLADLTVGETLAAEEVGAQQLGSVSG